MSTPVPKNTRLHPRWWGSRYHVLTGLRKALEKVFDDHLRPGRVVLDFGCGGRPYESLVTSRGASYLGADLAGRPGVDRLVDEHGRIDMADGSVDIVLSTQVLEHVPDARLYLSEAHRVLRTDGMLILSTHGYWQYHPDPKDLWRWTGPGLRAEIRDAGFDVTATHGILNLGAAGVQLCQDFVTPRMPPRLGGVAAAILQCFVGIINMIPAGGTENEAAVFLIVAKRVEPETGALT